MRTVVLTKKNDSERIELIPGTSVGNKCFAFINGKLDVISEHEIDLASVEGGDESDSYLITFEEARWI